jgi:hypothetical protein
MPDGEQVEFKSPTTGIVKAVPTEHWDEALKAGYAPVKHKVLYSLEGQRGLVPDSQLAEKMKAGYQTTPKTSFEKERPGKGITMEGSGGAAWDMLKGMVPPDPTGGRSLLDPKAWFDPSQAKFDPLHGGIAEAGGETKAGWERGRGDVRAQIGEASTSGLASLFGLGSGKRMAEQAARGEGGKIIGEAAVPATIAIAGATLPKVLPRMVKPFTKAFSKTDPLTKINEALGVRAKEIRPGKLPTTQQEFLTNPARGVEKLGLDEKALKKMSPIERNKVITEARDSVGKQLQSTLDAATKEGRKVNLRSMVDDVFKEIPDKNIQAQTRAKLTQIVNKAMGRPNVFGKVPYTKLLADLDDLTPSQAREIQRGLDDFANFAPEGTARSFKDVATKLRRGISAKTRLVVPESAPFDQQYGDLANAVKATQRQVTDFARTTPENKLRRWIIRGVMGAAKAASGVPIP